MKIVKIKCTNDKVLGNLEIDFTNEHGKIMDTIILAGENGVGKTRLLDIIYKFSNGTLKEYNVISNEVYEFEIEFDEGELLNLMSEEAFPIDYRDVIMGNRIKFVLDCTKKNNSCKIIYTNMNNDIIDIDSDFILWPESRKHLITSYSTTQVNFNVKKINTVTAKNIDELLDRSLIQNEDLATEIAQLLVDIDALDNSDIARWVKQNPGQIPSDEIVDIRMKRFKNAFEYMFPTKKLFEVRNINGYKEVLFEENEKVMNIDELSSGEKQVVFRGGFLLKDRDINKGVVLIDEPEISLHPTWQMKIVEFFRMLHNRSDGSSLNQIIITTHSPFIIHNEYRKNDKVIILKKDINGKATVDNEGKYYGWKNEELIERAFNIDYFIDNIKLSDNETVIITEGKTDWMHMKHAYNKLLQSGKINPMNIKFLEYTDSLGDSRLLELCKNISIMDNKNKFICIFDRDKDDYVKKVTEKGKDYKYYKNKVYSMAIPVPKHREDTPQVCIEHYYLDGDIKKEKDGKRIYIGNEFSRKSGVHCEFKNIFCVSKDKCGDSSYKIIDSDCFVAKIEDENQNIAMSKNNFAKYILDEVDEFLNVNIDEFKMIFDVISEIESIED